MTQSRIPHRWSMLAITVSVAAISRVSMAQTFSDTGGITIPESGPAAPYPATIEVTGLTEPITNITVTLSGFSHTFPSDVDILLVSPTGQAVKLMADAGAGCDANGVELSFHDNAPSLGAICLTSGVYRPSDVDGVEEAFQAPAPPPPYAQTLSAFAGTDGNGVWQLFVTDDGSPDDGSIGGWSLTFVGPKPFTYQGRLVQSGEPVNDVADFSFTLFDDATGGTPIADTAVDNVPVSDGLFTVAVPLPARSFGAGPRWLEVAVRVPAGEGTYTPLSPRQMITPAPESYRAQEAVTANALAAPDGDPLRAVIVTPDGNVGVGTETPGEKLSVNGIIESKTGGFKFPDGSVMTSAASGGGSWTLFGSDLYSNNPGNIGIGTTSPSSKLEVVGKLTISEFSGDIALGFNRSTTEKARLYVPFPEDTLRLRVGTVDAMAISPGGNIAIGAANTTHKLHINGNLNVAHGVIQKGGSAIATTSDLGLYSMTPGWLRFVTNGSPIQFFTDASNGAAASPPANSIAMSITPTHHIGIGTTNPGTRLEVAGGIRARGGPPMLDGSGDVGYAFSNGGDSGMFSTADGEVAFYSNAAEVMQIAPSGNVGIGVTDAPNKLSVAGIADFDGPVGVGTVSPQAALHIRSTTNDHTLHLEGEDWAQITFFPLGYSEGSRGSIYADGETLTIRAADAGKNVHISTWGGGSTQVNKLQILGGSDIAEPFDVRSDHAIEPGMVVCIDPDNPGKLRQSAVAYDHTVAGIVSGAGGIDTGMTLSQEGTLAAGKYPVALTGRIYCLVDADAGGAVRPGDLLTTSNTPGHAMKAADRQRASGAILGKAMTSLERGKGLVLVLVSLQ